MKTAKQAGDPDAITAARQRLDTARADVDAIKAAHRNETAHHEGDVTPAMSNQDNDNRPGEAGQSRDPALSFEEQIRVWHEQAMRDFKAQRQARRDEYTRSHQDTSNRTGQAGDVTANAPNVPPVPGFSNTNIAAPGATVGSQHDVYFGATPVTQDRIDAALRAAQSRLQQAQQQASDATARAQRKASGRHGPTVNIASGNDRIAQQNGINFGDTHHH